MVKVNSILSVWLLMACMSCSWSSHRGPSVLVVAVEGLSFDLVSCESDQMASRDMEGFRILCNESVRFSHAYSTSTLSEASLTSLLTGLYPLEHGIRHNGNDYLSAKILSVAEAATAKGFRTSFISGGPPVLRKSGLSQGFEIFDDNVDASEFYRPAPDNFSTFLNWLRQEVIPNKFFAAIYLSDLQFPDKTTKSDLGEIRDRSQAAQVREIGESLAYLFKELRRLNLWHSTTVVVTGLNGSLNDHREEILPFNLYGENTQVALFIKPASKARDLGIEWSIDKNVSLADLGVTLFDLIGAPRDLSTFGDLPRVSLRKVLDRPEVDWSDERLILIESGWGHWRGLSPIRYAVRFKQYLYLHDREPKIFNTLIDRLENSPLPLGDPLWSSLSGQVLNFFSEKKLAPWFISNPEKLERVKLAEEFWRLSGEIPLALEERLVTRARLDQQLAAWLIGRALKAKDGARLVSFGEALENRPAIYVGKVLLNGNPKAIGFDCAALFQHAPRVESDEALHKLCGDEMFLKLYAWANHKDEDRKNRSREAFFRMRSTSLQEESLGFHNYVRHLAWDAPLEIPRGVSLSDLYLSLPQNAKLDQFTRFRTLGKNRGLDL